MPNSRQARSPPDARAFRHCRDQPKRSYQDELDAASRARHDRLSGGNRDGIAGGGDRKLGRLGALGLGARVARGRSGRYRGRVRRGRGRVGWRGPGGRRGLSGGSGGRRPAPGRGAPERGEQGDRNPAQHEPWGYGIRRSKASGQRRARGSAVLQSCAIHHAHGSGSRWEHGRPRPPLGAECNIYFWISPKGGDRHCDRNRTRHRALPTRSGSGLVPYPPPGLRPTSLVGGR